MLRFNSFKKNRKVSGYVCAGDGLSTYYFHGLVITSDILIHAFLTAVSPTKRLSVK